ncbi:hypothetical protein C5167_017674 [Papaver somniferum]|uniref:Protein MIZU-KUSSEI 1 n=1 Tax=Papaver somniferum TaxID=3469 RepID=A0A4Y7IP25_PAPSO|nr:hypothetical protein C5167_017674 [Papaver somniferum]
MASPHVGSDQAPFMGEPNSTSTTKDDPSDDSTAPPTPPPLPPRPSVSLVEPHHKKKQNRVFRVFRSVFRSFPIITPMCKLPIIHSTLPEGHRKEMTAGMVRIALECEKRTEKDKMKLLDEPLWTMYCNGKKSGYGVKRDATEEDLHIMELLKAVSMGAGVLPGNLDDEGPDGELAYMRAHFERVVGSKDSETLYMLSPDGNNGPELSIFFVRI